VSTPASNRFRDVCVGAALPALVRVPTREQLVRYAGAASDYSAIHYDDGYAKARGFDSVIVHGLLKAAFLAQLVEQWMGEDAWIKRMSTEYRGVDLPGQPLICRGTVAAVEPSGGGGTVELDLWVENVHGDFTTRGRATVVFGQREVAQ
jgi:acyl dehydratase